MSVVLGRVQCVRAEGLPRERAILERVGDAERTCPVEYIRVVLEVVPIPCREGVYLECVFRVYKGVFRVYLGCIEGV